MSTAKVNRLILERLGGGTMLLALHVALDPKVDPSPSWRDGVDADGRAVHLVGAHAVRQLPQGEEAIQAVLEAAAEGHTPPGVQAVGYRPKAAEAMHEAWVGVGVDQILNDGPRGTGKTQTEGGMVAGMAEQRARAGFDGPLIVLWLHSSLTNAKAKTIPSLQQSHWGGLWTFRDDHQTAVLTVGGIAIAICHFVGTTDSTSNERLRAEAHMVLAEEVIPSLDEGGGISDRHFDLARTSMRLPTHRRIAVAVTNPGDPMTWPYKRFIEGGGQEGCIRCQIPANDRLTPEEEQRQIDEFATSPDLQARLGRGEWTALLLGERVAEGYDPEIHVAPKVLTPSMEHVLAIGWDGGHSPSAVIGQIIGGQVRVYAALNDLHIGVLELIEDQLIPWLMVHAPWVRERRGGPSMLQHIIDPSMRTGAEHSIRESSERTISDTLRGRMAYGPVPWSPRREAVLRVLAPRNEGGKVPLAISPVKETEIIRAAYASRWFYPQTPDGRVDRSRPKKPNSPWADIGDASAYLFGWLQPGSAKPPKPPGWKPGPTKTFFRVTDHVGGPHRRRDDHHFRGGAA